MDDTEFWYYIRKKMREVPIELRSRWTENEVRDWWEIRKRVNHLPARKEGRPIPDPAVVVRMCQDLVGEQASN